MAPGNFWVASWTQAICIGSKKVLFCMLPGMTSWRALLALLFSCTCKLQGLGCAGTAKIADVGLARIMQHTMSNTATGDPAGTFAYAAPEMLMGEKWDDKVGCCLSVCMYICISAFLSVSQTVQSSSLCMAALCITLRRLCVLCIRAPNHQLCHGAVCCSVPMSETSAICSACDA